VSQDNIEAIRWFKKAADQGSGFSQYQLAKMLKKGLGITKNYFQSMYYYKQAAEQGDKESLKKLLKYNEEPLLTLVLTLEWPKTQKYLHPKCQSAIKEIFYLFQNPQQLPKELIFRIAILLIGLWPKSEPHCALYIQKSST